MPPSLCRGRCIRFFESRSNKRPYAVVLEIAHGIAVIARGTSQEHPAKELIAEIGVGEKGSSSWRPPLNTMTRFYASDIRRVSVELLADAELGGFCRVDIFDRLVAAMQATLAAPEEGEP